MEEDSGRVSIWSVKGENRHVFAALFSILFISGIGFSIIYEVAINDCDGILDTLFAIIEHILPIGLASVILAFFGMEGGDTVGVALELFRKQRFREGRGSLAEELLKKAEESGETMPDEIQEILEREAKKYKDERK